MIPRCDCGRPADRGGYCSVRCELNALVIEEEQAARAPEEGGPRAQRLGAELYHGDYRRDDS